MYLLPTQHRWQNIQMEPTYHNNYTGEFKYQKKAKKKIISLDSLHHTTFVIRLNLIFSLPLLSFTSQMNEKIWIILQITMYEFSTQPLLI